ncbi:hypothetical protein DENSPDRAFT_831044 [Dentipellis sp. KUC8613]|nr:hypothetical protein DENSPDRAFT_831044 [Dentipellis sp. KUC8613]
MSLVQFRIELPSYSYSFHIKVPHSSTIPEVKHEIFLRCPGGPRVEGQRLVWRGRFLRDEERLDNIVTPGSSHTMHLAVHPSAWTGSPPNSTTTPPAYNPAPPPPRPIVTPPTYPGQQTPSYMAPQPQSLFAPTQMVQPAPSLTFIAYTHNNALAALTENYTTISSPGPEIQSAKAYAKTTIESYGYIWPEIFDAPYPAVSGEQRGVKYERVTIHGRDYLSLATPNATPTPLQEHCLKLLTYTFPLLSVPSSITTPAAYTAPQTVRPEHIALPPHMNPYLPQNVNARLQGLGLQPLRVAQPAPAAAEARAIPIRALLAPLMLLTLRTMFLLYFFSPFQKPLFGFIVGAWLLYETWNTIRNALGDPAARNRDRVAQNAGNNGNGNGNGQGAGGPPAPNRAANPQAQGEHRGPVPPPASGIPQASGHDAFLETLARFNTAEEWDALLSQRPISPRLRSMGHRVLSFFALLVFTVHPAFWNRRRAMLRRREGHVRQERRAREPVAEEGTAEEEVERRERLRAVLITRHTRRPEWVREYIERVLRGDWVEE